MGPIRAMLADVGITEQQWRVLRVLQEEGPQEPTKIAERACLLLPSLTRILQKLEEKGLITRHQDSKDRRRQIIEITADGLSIIRENLMPSIRAAERIRAHLGHENYESLLDLLGELNEMDG